MPRPPKLVTGEPMSADTLKDLFIDGLRDAYDAEHRISRAMSKMVAAARGVDLVEALRAHLAQTREHLARLEDVFDVFDLSPRRKQCKAIVGLLAECEGLTKAPGALGLRDVALIAMAHKIEHYEIATYGCLRTWAEWMGQTRVGDLLQATLEEEGVADFKLARLERHLDVDALLGENVGVETDSTRLGRRAEPDSGQLH